MIIRRILAALRIGDRRPPAPEFTFRFVHPIQEIAAESATLDRLRDDLRAKNGAAPPAPPVLPAASLTGWPLVYDEQLPPGEVHCRPTPGAPPPPTRQQITDLLQALMRKEQPGG